MRKSIHSKEHAVFIERLRQARLDADLTQAEAAKKLGCTQSYISKIESGELRVDAVALRRFAKVYRKDIAYFIK
ncbi:helix-turn-helix transcriptional regulator [Candidatus Kaiserbacteria bacterium]|nr:helix-turn-helix transcriptional regulator [Candidatus Kaiserbacteria bacterium]